MRKIVAKVAIVTVVAMFCATVLGHIVFYAAGKEFSALEWFMSTVIAPLVTIPIACYVFHQSQKLEVALDEATVAQRQLVKAHEALKLASETDAMTGLLNRAAFFAKCKQRLGSELSGYLLLVDIDHFKSVNDRFGHLAGDKALKAIAENIARSVRQLDLVSCLGSKEFGIYLTGATEEIAKSIGERIRHNVNSHTFMSNGGDLISFSVSIGGTLVELETDLKQALQQATSQLYKAKDSGRNAVRFHLEEAAA